MSGHSFLFVLTVYCLFFSPFCSGYKTDLVEGIMVESLRNYHVQACENERVTLHCPRNTHLLIETVFYGRLIPSNELCPNPAATAKLTEDTSCDLPEAHSRILELCRNKRKCKIHVRPATFERDPCEGTTKYLQVSYKCRPISFEDQNFCEGSRMELSCRSGKRLSIYSAHFGRTVATQATHCSLRDPVVQDCVSDVLPQVLHRCHAQHKCELPVDERFFGQPCPMGISKFLSLVYTCVNEEVFSDQAIKGQLESMQTLEEELKEDRVFVKPQQEESFSIAKVDSAASFEIDGEDGAEKAEPDVQLMIKDGKSAISELRPEVQRGIEVGISTHNFQSEPIDRKVEVDETEKEVSILARFLNENGEKTTLYLLLSAACGVILVLLVCACHQCRMAKREKQSTNSQRSLLKSSQSVIEQGSLLSNHSPPIYLDADNPLNYEDCSSPFSHRQSSQHYVRFSQVVPPPRAPLSLHYYS